MAKSLKFDHIANFALLLSGESTKLVPNPDSRVEFANSPRSKTCCSARVVDGDLTIGIGSNFLEWCGIVFRMFSPEGSSN